MADLHLVPAGGPSSRRRVEQIAEPYRAAVAVNASFFDADGRAMDLVVDEGRAISTTKRRSWGAFVVDGNKERTAVCAEGNVVVLVVATKVETAVFARFPADPRAMGGLGCHDALNLDGGPSAQLVVKLPVLTLSVPGGWEVPNALVATPGRR